MPDPPDDTPPEALERLAFPTLAAAQLERLRGYGAVRAIAPGDVLFREGERSYPFVVVLAGAVTLTETVGGRTRTIARRSAGQFLGELNLLSQETVFLTATADEPGEALVIDPGRLLELLGREQELGEIIVQAFLARRTLLQGRAAGATIVGSRAQPGALELREFATRNRLPFSWLDLDEDDSARALLDGLGVAPEATPVVLLQGGRRLDAPSVAEFADALGVRSALPAGRTYDLAVVGAGPAGLSAAVYGASEGLDTVAIDAVAPGGQAGTSSRIENYLGFPAGLSGGELANRALAQARRFGARISAPERARALVREGDRYRLDLGGGALHARSVVIATGARYRKLPLPRLERFEGNGVFYAATGVEAQRCAGERVLVVGGGNSAGQAALFLARSAAAVDLLVRGDGLARSMSRYLVARVESDPAIRVRTRTEVRALHGDGRLERVDVERTTDGRLERVAARALFLFIGADPATDWLSGVGLDEDGFVLTGERLRDDAAYRDLGRRPYYLETSLPGVFAVGDVRSDSVKRVASSVGEGAMAIRFVHEVLAGGG